MTKLKIALVGCVRFSQSMLEELLTMDAAEIRGIVTKRQSTFNVDFRDIAMTAAPRGIPIFYAALNEQAEMAAWLKTLDIDVLFCFGWPYLLQPQILELPPLKAVGYHPALLPRNRGRHPIIWALALGLPETGSTFFLMDKGADSGPIMSQQRVLISLDDDAESLYTKLESTARRQLRLLVESLRAGSSRSIPQDHTLATYWRKRGKADGCIDWRMPAMSIYNLVRALSPPYPGAHFEYRGSEVKVWKTRIGAAGDLDVEPGFVLGCEGNALHLQCGMGSTIHLEVHELRDSIKRGDYL